MQARHLRHFSRGASGPAVRDARRFDTRRFDDGWRHHGADKRDAGRDLAGDLCADLPADGTTPSAAAIRNEEHARLEEALQRLPEKQRLVFELRFKEGLPFEEVARRVDVTVVNARVLMLRATEKLKTDLGEQA